MKPLIESAFEQLPDVDVRIFPPGRAPDAADLSTQTTRPAMTVMKAAFIATMRRYSEIALDVSLIEVQKLMYFLQVAGEDMRLDYAKGHYGPYADNLRKALRSMEGHFITGLAAPRCERRDGPRPDQLSRRCCPYRTGNPAQRGL